MNGLKIDRGDITRRVLKIVVFSTWSEVDTYLPELRAFVASGGGVLEGLGLTAEEERVYQLLLDVASTTPEALAADLDMPVVRVRALLTRVEEHGLASRDGHHYVAAPPAVAVGALLNQRRDELRHVELAMATLTERYRASAVRHAADLVEVIPDAGGVRQRFLQLQHRAEREVLSFVTAMPVVITSADNTAELPATRRGVRFRAVLERAALEEPGVLDGVMQAITDGAEARVVDRLPLKLMIADRTDALVPLGADGQSAVLVRRSGMLNALIALFEQVWDRSWPIALTGAESSEELSDLDVKILSLLLAGCTDESVAKQLRLSARTVQRRVRALMDVAGADTRLQLGWYAAQRGWA